MAFVIVVSYRYKVVPANQFEPSYIAGPFETVDDCIDALKKKSAKEGRKTSKDLYSPWFDFRETSDTEYRYKIEPLEKL